MDFIKNHPYSPSTGGFIGWTAWQVNHVWGGVNQLSPALWQQYYKPYATGGVTPVKTGKANVAVTVKGTDMPTHVPVSIDLTDESGQAQIIKATAPMASTPEALSYGTYNHAKAEDFDWQGHHYVGQVTSKMPITVNASQQPNINVAYQEVVIPKADADITTTVSGKDKIDKAVTEVTLSSNNGDVKLANVQLPVTDQKITNSVPYGQYTKITAAQVNTHGHSYSPKVVTSLPLAVDANHPAKITVNYTEDSAPVTKDCTVAISCNGGTCNFKVSSKNNVSSGWSLVLPHTGFDNITQVWNAINKSTVQNIVLQTNAAWESLAPGKTPVEIGFYTDYKQKPIDIKSLGAVNLVVNGKTQLCSVS